MKRYISFPKVEGEASRQAHADIPPGMTGLMERARSKLREGDVEISLRGYSHVYVHTSDAGSTSASDQELLEESAGVRAWQEVFDRPDLRKLVEAYAKGSGTLDARTGLGGHKPWDGHDFRKPAARVPSGASRCFQPRSTPTRKPIPSAIARR